ncbi:DUF4065 domain-containing protein [bacterium]|nr:MAG: DUF4065 domain-containing protein [bacterium]
MLIPINLKKLDSLFLCEYILQKCGSMSHLKLQKLLYYIEAYHLAFFEESIIDDDFEAWLHGPVSRKVYNQIKGLSVLYTEISFTLEEGKLSPADEIQKLITQDQLELVNDVLSELGKMTSSQLETLSHNELPWKESRQSVGVGDRCNKVISKDIMKKFYREELYGKAT